MKNKSLKMLIAVGVVLLMAGFGTIAFADWGGPYGRHRMGYGPDGYGDGCGYGQPWHRQGAGSPWDRDDLSQEEAKKLQEEREAFFDATRELRGDLRQKRLELESELAKKEPDSAKALSIQKEISDLRAQFDQKRIEHRISMHKLFPDAGPRKGPGFYGKQGLRGGRQGGCWY